MKPLLAVAAGLLLCLAVPFETSARNTDGPTTTRSTHTTRGRRQTRTHRAGKPSLPPQAATTTASGLTYVITQHGAGRYPLAGETVIVNYTGLLGSGAKFDSSLDHGKPFEFRLGAGRVIKGWDEGIAKLHVGDQATLIIPPQLGYGARGAGGVIPPNATLIFLVELVGIKEDPNSN